MLTAEQNDELTQVAAGTPMGELLRRYWYPVAFTRELEEFPVRPARLLGEDFAVFKTPRGKYGILPEGCPHRRASLTYGVVEPDGLRCAYHGWLFGTDGSCLDQPAEREETNFRSRVRAAAGVAQELGGLVWAYIGPSPAPELPRFDVFVMDGVRDIGWTFLPCNFVQIMENAVDPHHTEWLHGRFFEFMARHQGFDAPPSFGKKHVKVATRWCSPTTCGSAAPTSSRCRSGCRSTGPPPGSCSTPCTRLLVWSTPISRRCLTTRSRCTTPAAGTGWTMSRVRT
jgi:5,5'-dehydrodivanillate O-demethylase